MATPRVFTKRSTVIGLPVGRRTTDWRKIGAVGAGLVSVAGSITAKRRVGDVSSKIKEPISKGKDALQNLGKVGDQAGAVGSAMGGASSPIGKVAAAVKSVGSSDSGGDGGDGGEAGRNVKKLRLIIKESIDVGVPRKVAYNQWTQFAELPSIVKGVASVDQEEDDKTRWTAKIGPSRRSWRAEIVEQNPDERIAWESTDGTENRGAVTFHSLDRNLTRVQVEMEYFPKGIVEKTGNVFLAARRRVRKDLRLFKHYLELAGQETGAWRGEISKDGEGSEGQEGQEGGDDEQSTSGDGGEQAERTVDLGYGGEESHPDGDAHDDRDDAGDEQAGEGRDETRQEQGAPS